MYSVHHILIWVKWFFNCVDDNDSSENIKKANDKQKETLKNRKRENGMQISNFKMEMHLMALDWMELNRIESNFIGKDWNLIEAHKSVNINTLPTLSRSQSISVKAIISVFSAMCVV